jgi:hypothetical protein
MSNTSTFSNDATNKIRIFNNDSSSYFDFASQGDSKLHWRYGSSSIEFLTFNGSNGDVTVKGNLYAGNIEATIINTTSDYRVKENPILLNETFFVDSLKPMFYKNKMSNKEDMGFLAHEVQEIFPFLVNGEKDGDSYQSLNYNGFIALLVKEIQELKKRLQTAEELLQDVNNKINAMQ